MDESQSEASTTPKRRGLAWQTFQWFASLQLAVMLLAGLAAILAVATLLESANGREYALWHVYKSAWFMALLGLLSLNILAAMLVRFPWRSRHAGFLLAHVGVLAVLAGAFLTFLTGVEGQLVLEEGQSGDRLVMVDRDQLAVTSAQHEKGFRSILAFDPGPTDWPEHTTLRLGTAGGVKLELLKYYRHARTEEHWDEAPESIGVPAVQVALASPDGKPMIDQWFVADPFADEVYLGPVRLLFQRAVAASMLEDFISPPAVDTKKNPDGILSLHYEGRMYRIPVRENLGKKVPVGKSDVRVEIVSYLPDARPDAAAHFKTVSQQPNNPLLELKVYVPGKDKPLRQIAFAKNPLLNLDNMHGWNCPVKLWYHHPAVVPEAGVQFLQTPDGKLHYRVIAKGKMTAHGEAKSGSRIPTSDRLRLSIAKYLPHARLTIKFLPVRATDTDETAPESAVLVRVSAGGDSQEIWLRRADPDYGYQQISTPEGPVVIAFGYETAPLGFSLKLVQFRHEMNPGMMGDASFASSVRVIDTAKDVNKPAEIAMNQPLTYGGYTFYQSSFGGSDSGKQTSVFTVASDPGRLLKYLGCLLTCFGVFGVFYGRSVLRFLSSLTGHGRATGVGLTAAIAICASATLAAAAGAASADEGIAAAFDWRPWQSLPVQEGGRQKPFDTLARETLRTINGRSSVFDPKTQRTLDPTAFYLSLFFTGQAWDRSGTSPHGMPAAVCPGQPAKEQEDAWDRKPLLLVGSASLRAAMGLPPDQKYISSLDLSRAMIEIPKSGVKSRFLVWAQTLLRDGPRKPDKLQKNGMELAERYWAYKDVRSGRKLEILPLGDSKTQQWVSTARLMQTNWDEKTDPTGKIRKAKGELQRARTAYLKDAAGDFNAASANFVALLRDVGPQLGNYPTPGMIDLEVAYNHWTPFSIAWICMSLALLGMLLSRVSRLFSWVFATFFAAGILAMLAGFGMRMIIAGRAPVTNMYESVVFVGLGTAVLGVVFQLVYRKCYLLAAAAVVTALTLILADACPTILDPAIRPLTPVLRSNFWLAVHVMTIMLSYAAFAMALLSGNVTLGFYLCRRVDLSARAVLSKATYRLLQAGVLLLILGTFLGASWADYAWGRFWGWDPKEVWALITLLGYLALLHARRIGWLGDFGTAAWSVLCFALILMAWYGVNYVLGTGLHSYGFGGGGQGYVVAGVAVQLLYVGAATLRVAGSDRLRATTSPA
jgi:cytochrome c-type biogenesis protein CcsB